MEPQASHLTLGLLPDSRTPWEKYLFSYGMQSAVLAVFLVTAMVYPEVLVLPAHDYHFVQLVETPAPVPQTPAPLRNFRVPKIAEISTPRPEALRVPSDLNRPRKDSEIAPPKVELAAKVEKLPEAVPAIPKQLVRTNVFSTGSSAIPTMAAAPQRVQTGGFGDPNGVPANDNHGRPITIAQAGSFDLPRGPGLGNGTGGSKGARAVVASAGFGAGVATGDGSSRANASRGTVREAGFGDADVVSNPQPRSKSQETAVRTVPAEITFKPRPIYTDEGRRLKIEGEVLVEVVFTSNGQVRVLRVVQGLGHGLDESAVHAAEKIQFKPALKDGQPADFQAVLHIVFQLA